MLKKLFRNPFFLINFLLLACALFNSKQLFAEDIDPPTIPYGQLSCPGETCTYLFEYQNNSERLKKIHINYPKDIMIDIVGPNYFGEPTISQDGTATFESGDQIITLYDCRTYDCESFQDNKNIALATANGNIIITTHYIQQFQIAAMLGMFYFKPNSSENISDSNFTESQLAGLKWAFAYLDLDNSGTIEGREIFTSLGVNKVTVPYSLNFMDFKNNFKEMQEDKTRNENDVTLAKLKEIFSRLDKDGDGEITTIDIGTVIRARNAETSEAKNQDIINEIDADGTGTIDFLEFIPVFNSL